MTSLFYKLGAHEGLALLGLTKNAAGLVSPNTAAMLKRVGIGGAGGAALGAGVGALRAPEGERGSHALAGAALGGTLGAGMAGLQGHLMNRELAGLAKEAPELAAQQVGGTGGALLDAAVGGAFGGLGAKYTPGLPKGSEEPAEEVGNPGAAYGMSQDEYYQRVMQAYADQQRRERQYGAYE